MSTEDKKLNHRLMKQLLSAETVTEEEMVELYEDLRNIYDNPSDGVLEDAIVNRGCTYVEQTVEYMQ